MKLLKNCTKETSALPAIQKPTFYKIYLIQKYMECRDYLLLPDNAQQTLKKLVWK